MRGWLALPIAAAAALLSAQHPVPPKAERGRTNATCRSGETGPAARFTIRGLKDRKGTMRVELYPANDKDFLAKDKDLIAAGKAFKRVDVRTPASGPVVVCIRAPAPGLYTFAVLHDRDSDGKVDFLSDGAGFPGNPKIGLSKPRASSASLAVPNGVAAAEVRMNYRRGLGYGPIGEGQ